MFHVKHRGRYVSPPLYPPYVSTLLCYPTLQVAYMGAQLLTKIFPENFTNLKKGFIKRFYF